MTYNKSMIPYRESKEEIEKWIVEHIKAELRNVYRKVAGVPLNEKDPMSKT